MELYLNLDKSFDHIKRNKCSNRNEFIFTFNQNNLDIQNNNKIAENSPPKSHTICYLIRREFIHVQF